MVLDAIGSWVFGGVGQAGLAIALVAAVLYYRRALGLGRILSTWAGRIAFGFAMIGVGILLGVIPSLDLARASSLITTIVEWLEGVWPLVVDLLPLAGGGG